MIGTNQAKLILKNWLATEFAVAGIKKESTKLLLLKNSIKRKQSNMVTDIKQVETLVEIITREVLLSIAEKEERGETTDGLTCVVEVANGVKVKTCFDNAGHVISAGAERLTSTVGVIPQDTSLARMIDHTLLKPDATSDKIAQLCFEAKKYHFASVCVNPTM